jgi:hypothetical protein
MSNEAKAVYHLCTSQLPAFFAQVRAATAAAPAALLIRPTTHPRQISLGDITQHKEYYNNSNAIIHKKTAHKRGSNGP